ncbi:MAG: hypothetical protein C0594_00130, partial [Marinilabiliales bacterium]
FIPLIFYGLYVYHSYEYQVYNEFFPKNESIYNLIAFTVGYILFILLSLSYFFTTNKDIYKMYGIRRDTLRDKKILRPVKVVLKKDMAWKIINAPRENAGRWRITTYLQSPIKIRRAKEYSHYSPEMLQSVLQQNHKNAAIFALVIILVVFILRIFIDQPYMMIPAAASITLMLTLLILLYSVFTSIFREWSLLILAMLFVGINYASQYTIKGFQDNAYGLAYSLDSIQKPLDSTYSSVLHPNEDLKNGLQILNKWKAKNNDTKRLKPKLIVVCTSGGGLKATAWTYLTLAHIDSLSQGRLMRRTHLYTGASGGMIGAAFLRQVYLDNKINGDQSLFRDTLFQNLTNDMLNPIAFSLAVNDWIFKFQKFNYKGTKYYKDRAYAFDVALNRNTCGILNKSLSDYCEPEQNADIPLMILSPTVINDGRKMLISPQGLSYLILNSRDPVHKNRNIDFRRMYTRFNADSLSFISALRMNASFPYVTPMVNMPGKPKYYLMDAGIHDNYGISTAMNYLYVFRDWINTNTSGVVIVKITSQKKQKKTENMTLFSRIFTPLGNIYSNLFEIQNINNEQILEYGAHWFYNNIEVIDLSLANYDNYISISWHLTKAEKKSIEDALNSHYNQLEIERLLYLLK